MVVISRSRINEFGERHANAVDAMNQWFFEVRAADWNSFNSLKETFQTADYIADGRVVFNIRGNKYRIVAMIHFDVRTVYIRFIGTHAEYDKIDASSI